LKLELWQPHPNQNNKTVAEAAPILGITTAARFVPKHCAEEQRFAPQL
jgi:hypothetical protein